MSIIVFLIFWAVLLFGVCNVVVEEKMMEETEKQIIIEQIKQG